MTHSSGGFNEPQHPKTPDCKSDRTGEAADAAEILAAHLSLDDARPVGRRADQYRNDCVFEVKSLFVRCVFQRSRPSGDSTSGASNGASGVNRVGSHQDDGSYGDTAYSDVEDSSEADDYWSGPEGFAGGLFDR